MNTETPNLPGPLAEASPKSLDDLFNSDPEGLNNVEIDKITATLREHRERVQAAGGDAKSTARSAPKAPTGSPRIAAPGGKVSLKDLGLD